jgi:predicted nucleic acid-binding Zn ribbon protein
VPPFSAITYIYALVDPTDDVIRYVGKADHPALRLRQHLRPCALNGRDTGANEWLKDLVAEGRCPILKALEVVPEDDWQFAECWWIGNTPTALNIEGGGRGQLRTSLNPRSPGVILYVCEQCGTHFSLPYYRKGTPRFCGWACFHASRGRNYPIIPVGRTVEEAFDLLVEKTAGCWNWIGARNASGYGVFAPGKHIGSGSKLAHVVSYERFVGPVPARFELDHACRNPPCVKPSHLEAVTHAENMRRGYFATKTHCPLGHPYDESNTIFRNGRKCRECMQLCNKASNERRNQRVAANGSPNRLCAVCGEAFTYRRLDQRACSRECGAELIAAAHRKSPLCACGAMTQGRATERGHRCGESGPIRKTRCSQGHEFTDANTRINPAGARVCRICSRAACIASRNRRRAA